LCVRDNYVQNRHFPNDRASSDGYTLDAHTVLIEVVCTGARHKQAIAILSLFNHVLVDEDILMHHRTCEGHALPQPELGREWIA
jgi:hypothetical protein